MSRASRWHYHTIQMPGPDRPAMVWIVDDFQEGSPSLSVTNDAEAVCKAVHAKYPNHRIIYCDTDGKWDELLHNAGVFKGYAPARDLIPPFHRRQS